jgi:amidase
MKEVVETLKDAGAEIVRANIPTIGWIGGPGTAMAVLNRNPESKTKYDPARPPIVFVYEMKHDLNAYLSEWAIETPIRTMADVIAFNEAHADRALRFGQDLLLAAEATKGDLSELEYKSARAMDVRSAATLGLDAYMDAHKLDAVLFAGNTGAAIAAKPGYPSVQVPAGFTAWVAGAETPDYPLGATFTGRAWSEPTLLRLAYAYEQASQARKPPAGYPAL